MLSCLKSPSETKGKPKKFAEVDYNIIFCQNGVPVTNQIQLEQLFNLTDNVDRSEDKAASQVSFCDYIKRTFKHGWSSECGFQSDSVTLHDLDDSSFEASPFELSVKNIITTQPLHLKSMTIMLNLDGKKIPPQPALEYIIATAMKEIQSQNDLVFITKQALKLKKVKEEYIPTICSSIQEIIQASDNQNFKLDCLKMLGIEQGKS